MVFEPTTELAVMAASVLKLLVLQPLLPGCQTSL